MPTGPVAYKYQVTGLDFGLQKQSRLVQSVQGRCITEYEWAAYVSSRDVFRESTMVVERHTIPNAVSNFVGGGDAAFAQFVLSSSEVSTLSLAEMEKDEQSPLQEDEESGHVTGQQSALLIT